MDCMSVGRNFGILNRRTQLYITNCCRQWRISYSEYVLLEQLYVTEGITQDELAALLYIDKAMVARGLKSLEEKGYLYRLKGERDKRQKTIRLTVKARNIEAVFHDVVLQWLKRITVTMSETDLQRMLDDLREVTKNAAEADLNLKESDEGDAL
ncbi:MULTISPECIES: MarR family winged helix-turn-helix transcriptional regulator [Megasphaera]|uniref:MarR family protein n=1 Tax=Megasphaera vaginalis (ex Srinivasan et al. 2021) TaxID=1111454 RepID=U7UHP1_9FIRM|nr:MULTISPECIES: MarR family winged helix-turn-helix transcriptional regulator [Megasphaera]ERT58409.1 MarR family protein [Megasphaera vaginalis (ex Srinivasan et al. 2021)]